MLRSLRNRLVLFTLAIVAVSVLAGDLAMTLTLDRELDEQMQRALSARVGLVEELDDLTAEQLHDVLVRREIPAVVEAPDGARLVSRADVVASPGASHTVERPDGSRVEVVVGRTTSDANLRRIYAAIAAGSVVAVVASLIVLGMFARRMLRPLESALDAARAAERRSRGFLADAAHQLRTPVAGVRAATEALLRSPEPAQQDGLLTNLAREATRTGQLLEALLRVARLDRGEEPARQHTDLVALVVAEVERQQALAPSLDLHLQAPPELVAAIDATAVREALANLLDNGRRHAHGRIDISLTATGREDAVIRVVDDGPGLEPGTEDAVFDRFVSLDDRGGSGLGLAIARGIARAHGGDVEWRDGGFDMRLRRR